MRLLIIPLLLVGLLFQTPTSALGNTNQQAAEKIAAVIGEQFPSADIDVQYRGGQVWLKGEADSQNQREKIVGRVFSISGINVSEVNDEIQVVASRVPAGMQAQTERPAASPTNVPVPMPNTANPVVVATAPIQAGRVPQPQAQPQQMPPQVPPPPQTWSGALLATAPQPYYPAAYGLKPGQQPAVPAPYAQTSYVQYPQAVQQPIPQQAQHQPAYYGPPPQAAYHPEAYGPQGPLPENYNQPNLPDYAWPAYANYPNYGQVTYPRSYSPKAWPYIGPFYPYPQVPIGWRKVTLEHSNGWWWLDFDDGTPSGPFSGLYRQPAQYTY